MIYVTCLGGRGGSNAYAVAADQTGAAYITGSAGAGFPTTRDAYQPGWKTSDNPGHSSADAFVTKLTSGGETDSGYFPRTPGAYQTTYKVRTDAFVTRLTTQGTLACGEGRLARALSCLRNQATHAGNAGPTATAAAQQTANAQQTSTPARTQGPSAATATTTPVPPAAIPPTPLAPPTATATTTPASPTPVPSRRTTSARRAASIRSVRTPSVP